MSTDVGPATPGQAPEHPAASGPFATALRDAIRARGLSLDRVQAKLADCGTPVSAAALSHWQSGRSQPERETSMLALGHLEQILGVCPGALASQIDPPRPRGRKSATEPKDFADVFHGESVVAAALERFDHAWTQGRDLVSLSSHDMVKVDARGGIASIWNRRVMRAVAAGPDRAMVLYHSESGVTPVIRAVRGCTMGRVFTDPTLPGVAIAELLTGQPLQRGDVLIMEHAVDFPASITAETKWERRFDRPVREYVVEVEFTAPRLPARCVKFTVLDQEVPDMTERVVQLDGYARASAVALDFGPGRYGIRWEWQDQSTLG